MIIRLILSLRPPVIYAVVSTDFWTTNVKWAFYMCYAKIRLYGSYLRSHPHHRLPSHQSLSSSTGRRNMMDSLEESICLWLLCSDWHLFTQVTGGVSALWGCVCVCVIAVNTVGVLCKFGRAVIITICQKKKVTAIVNLRSTERYINPPPIIGCWCCVRWLWGFCWCAEVWADSDKPWGDGTYNSHKCGLSQNYKDYLDNNAKKKCARMCQSVYDCKRLYDCKKRKHGCSHLDAAVGSLLL